MTALYTKLQSIGVGLAMALSIGATVVPAEAKNKENCHAIGGKWLPGSSTDLEKGACLFLIRAGSGDKNTLKKFAAEGAITADACTQQGGKITRGKTQCSIEMGK